MTIRFNLRYRWVGGIGVDSKVIQLNVSQKNSTMSRKLQPSIFKNYGDI